MTATAHLETRGEPSIWPTADTAVLRCQNLHHTTSGTALSRFGDDVWDLKPAVPDSHTMLGDLRWHKLDTPEPLVEQLKQFAFAMLDKPVPASLLGASAGDLAAVSTVSIRIRDLVVFVNWMASRDQHRFGDITTEDLEAYLGHVRELPRSLPRQAALLQAVRTLWGFAPLMPPHARLDPGGPPWNGELPNRLIGAVVSNRTNRTPRIAPATMEPLLAWALRMVEDIGPDIQQAWAAFVRFRSGAQPFHVGLDGMDTDQRITAFIDEAQRDGLSLPGRIDASELKINWEAFSRMLGLRRSISNPHHRARVQQAGLPIGGDVGLATIAGQINGRPWRERPIGTLEIRRFVRLLTAACFVVVCYLSGARPGEVLNLRRGCRGTDPATGELQISGRRGKGRGRSAAEQQTRTWTVVEPVHAAIAVLETLTDGDLLFPASPGRAGKPSRPSDRYARGTDSINRDIEDLITWVNNTLSPDGTALIPEDPTRHIHAARFRRTLAYFIVRRHRGLIAAALQYGHVSTKVTLSYSGMADTGWLDDLTLERLEMVMDQLDTDWSTLQAGESVSGPSATDYRMRVTASVRFAGRVVNTPRGARRLLAQADPNIHHGAGMTCVWRKETALCRKSKLEAGLPAEDVPDESECRSACQNLAYTDRDISELSQRLDQLENGADDELVPRPIRNRLTAQAEGLKQIIQRHRQATAQEQPR
ncbi:hypothetical protein GCM10009603_27880 [Nocardiopsis exhalans]